jgi:voltage-gated potassium channel
MIAAGEADIVANYTYWFFVTASTVGYGDYAPGTGFGRFVAVMIMLLGIGTITLVIAKITEVFLTIIGKRNRGRSSMKAKQHTVIMGYRRNNTEKIIDELIANNAQEKIVLCSSDLERNPFNQDNVEFIKGELASHDVLTRASIHNASRIIVYGSDDNQTFFTAYAIREVNLTAHLVCYLQNEDHAEKVYKLPAEMTCLNQVILPVNVYLLAQELQDPESSNVFHHLISNFKGATLFRADIPNVEGISWTFEELFLRFKREHDATIVAIKKTEIISNPSLSEEISGGVALFYISSKRLNHLSWEK